jgi:hypothetical protein
MNIDHCFFEKSNQLKKKFFRMVELLFFATSLPRIKKNKKKAKNRERRHTSKTLILERSLKKS